MSPAYRAEGRAGGKRREGRRRGFCAALRKIGFFLRFLREKMGRHEVKFPECRSGGRFEPFCGVFE